MASPLVTELKSVISLQTYLNVAVKKLLETDKYQILKITDQHSSRIDQGEEDFDRFTLEYTILDTTFKCILWTKKYIYINEIFNLEISLKKKTFFFN